MYRVEVENVFYFMISLLGVRALNGTMALSGNKTRL